MIDIATLTFTHTLLSIVAIVLGIPALYQLMKGVLFSKLITSFIATALLTTVTGFLFPLNAVTPAVATGIITSVIFVVMLAALKLFHLNALWKSIYALGILGNLYFLVFVAIAQGFQKISFLNDLAPTLSEPPFAVSQIAALLIFGWLGFKTARLYWPAKSPVTA